MTERRHVGRPRGGDPVETRRAVLDAAGACFAASGFAGATTRQVAARAGVNVATLRYHFGSKEELYRAVLDEATREEIPAPGNEGTPAERLSSAVDVLWRFGAAHPMRPRLRLFQWLSGSRTTAGIPEEPEDPRGMLLTRTLAGPGVKTPLPLAETARIILALLDTALVAAQNSRFPEGELPAGAPDTLRAAVVAAALRVAGLA